MQKCFLSYAWKAALPNEFYETWQISVILSLRQNSYFLVRFLMKADYFYKKSV